MIKKQTKSKVNQAIDRDGANLATEERILSLTQAFTLFTKETERLEEEYEDLKGKFQHVNCELAETVKQLHDKVIELDTSTHYLHSILTHMEQGLIFIGLSGIVTTYNPKCEELLQIEATRALFNPYHQNFPDDLFGFSLKNALETKSAPKHTSVQRRRPSGGVRMLEIDTSFVLTEAGTKHHTKEILVDPELDYTKGLIILVRDTTELYQLREVTARNERFKELGDMAGLVAHEIRNPLGGIKGFASLLKRDLEDNPRLEQMANYILDGADTLNSIITNVMNFSKPAELHLETVECKKALQNFVKELKNESLFSSLMLTLQVPKEDVFCTLDLKLMKGAIFELIKNAKEAMPEGGEITVLLKKEKEAITISIKDTGEGISLENQKKLYRPFFSTKARGKGFGLAEVYKIVQAHTGVISFTSEPKQGTTFTIKLPLKR